MLKDLTVIRSELLDAPIVKEDSLYDFKIPNNLKSKLKEVLSPQGYALNNYTSYAITDKAKEDKPANYAVIPNQYFSFASEMYEFSIELFKYFDLFDKVRENAKYLIGSFSEVSKNIKSRPEILALFESDNDIELFSKFLDKNDSSYRLGSKRLINDEGKPRGAKDCFSSVILKEINLPDASSSIFGKLVYELVRSDKLFLELKTFYDSKNKDIASVKSNNQLDLNTLPKPFILLAGISGTGKTRFVREQAKAFDAEKNNYCLVSVRPDWHEPSDLLGYVSRLSGTPKFISTKVLNFIIKAWKVIAPDASKGGAGDLDYDAVPYWLCLDEMNLAPVEQYFADYLSVLESREFCDDTYRCEALLDKGLLQDLATNDTEIQKTLGLEGNDDLWQYFLSHGIAIPPNLIVAGTVNMDETTHGFSRKVIDRALTIDFGEFFPNDYANYFQQKTRPKCFTYSKQSQASQDNLAEMFDDDGSRSIAFLSSVNDVLKHTPFELAYRALNELLLQVECFKPETEQQLRAVWDDFLMSKVLPRIDGDEDKLRVTKDDDTVVNLLEALSDLLEDQLGDIWNGTRFDFYRENSDGSAIDDISCRSKAKLIWMQNRLATNTFTSFWP